MAAPVDPVVHKWLVTKGNLQFLHDLNLRLLMEGARLDKADHTLVTEALRG